MIKTVKLPGCREDVVYNTSDVDDDGYVIGQGSRSGAFFDLHIDESGNLLDYTFHF